MKPFGASKSMVTPRAESVDPAWKGLYRAGGLAMLINAVLYVVGTVALLAQPSPSAGGEAYLKGLAGIVLQYRAAAGIFVVADFLFIPAILALALALKETNKTAVLVGTILLGASFLLDLGVNIPNLLALASLSQNYAAATTDVHRAAYVASADYILAFLGSSSPIIEYIGPSVGVLIISSVMLKGIFGKWTGYVGILASATGFLGVLGFSIPGLYPLIALFLPFAVVWFVLTGLRLYRLGKT